MEDPSVFQEKVKNTFKQVRKVNESLEAQIKHLKGILEEIREEIKSLKKEPETAFFEDSNVEEEPSSIGSEGVQANVQANKQINEQANVQANKQIISQLGKKDTSLRGLEIAFKSLTKQEFHIFLLIYELEDQGNNPTYEILSKKLSLTLSCLRGHICNIIKKGVPIMKKRLRDHSVFIHIDPDFKAITSQSKLIDFYYSIADPSQKKLTDI